MSVGIWDELEPRRRLVEAALDRHTRPPALDAPPAIAEAMRYSLLGGGKRLRPLLVLLACEAHGGSADAALPAAVAVEMVHTYSLVHDDLPAMDDDDLRRGRPTCHKVFGEALGILAGDALLTEAFGVLAGYGPRAADCCRALAAAAGPRGMVGGQTLDLIADGRIAGPVPTTLDQLEDLHRRKTGALFRASVQLGAFAAGGTDTADLDAFADCFGLLFQITDDLLDVGGTEAAAGKRVGKDAVRGKLTYPGLLGVDDSHREVADLCEQAVDIAAALGPPGPLFAALARWVVSRDR